MLRTTSIAVAVLALAACGPKQAESSASPAPAATSTAAPAGPSAEEIAAAVAALPAPYNEGDYAAGKSVFAQCRSCHTIEGGGPNRVGPNLHSVFGRHVGSLEGFAYSDALANADFVWDAEHLDGWLSQPRTFLPGNRMAFLGVRDETQRRNLITYLMVETKPE